MQENRGNISEKIRNMEVGKSLFFPPEKLGGIRVYCSNLSFQMGRIYKVHARRNEDKNVVEVIRTK